MYIFIMTDDRKMKGIQYTILADELSPNLILIEKLNRISPEEYHHLAYYYVLGGNIYQAPDFYSLINTRLVFIINKYVYMCI